MNIKTPSFGMERTYTVDTWQIFFADETELVVKVGQANPANTGDGKHIELDWQCAEPEWAVAMGDSKLIEMLGLGQ